MAEARMTLMRLTVLTAALALAASWTATPALPQANGHTMHPDAQWFPEAALGLFLHWDVSSVKGINIGWSVIPGRRIAARKETFSPEEVQRIVHDEDYNLEGKRWPITPNQYWALARDFKPDQYDPDKWLKAAKAAGFEYAVLTTKHHNGFALWPSKYGDFNTQNYMGGRDLLKEFVEACRHNHIKVGFYFSGPDWHFDREYFNFLYHGNEHPEFPPLDADLKPRTVTHTAEKRAAHQKAYAEMVRGQIEELLTNYGKIDVLWFDGKPAVPNAEKIVTAERIRELQPSIVINPRLHGHGDYVTYERTLPTNQKATGWAEFCNTWTNNWSYVPQPFRANGYVLGQLARSRSLGINYLLGVGPMPNGDLEPEVYANLAVVAEWMKVNGVAIKRAKPLPDGETASVPATAAGLIRYLFALPKFQGNGAYEKDMLPPADEQLTLSGVARGSAERSGAGRRGPRPSTSSGRAEPVEARKRSEIMSRVQGSPRVRSVTLLRDGSSLEYAFVEGALTVTLPASKRTKLVDVVRVELPSRGQSRPQ